MTACYYIAEKTRRSGENGRKREGERERSRRSKRGWERELEGEQA